MSDAGKITAGTLVVGWLSALVPPPRRRVTWLTVLPLVIFTAVFAVTCFMLSFFGAVTFAAPWSFGFVLVLPWLWWMHTAGYGGLSGFRSVAALVMRLALAGVFIMLLAEPRAVRQHDAMSAIFVLDLSMSIGNRTAEQAMQYVTRIAREKPPKDRVGLVMFGRNAAVELPPSTTLPIDEGLTLTLQIDRDGTNLEKALSLAAAVVPQGTQGRIIIISDGVKTEGSLTTLLDELKSQNIAVDVFPVDYEYANEVWIERLELPRNVKTGESYEASVILSSLRDGKGDLVLLENGQEIYREKNVAYHGGKNRFRFPIFLREPGYYEYTALIEPAKDKDGKPIDGIDKNNKAISYLLLKGEGKVLVVVDPAEQVSERDWGPLVETLRKAKRAVEVTSAYEFPTDPLTLLPYDCIMFVNVAADMFVASQFAALKDAVYNQGSGFIMVGGENSFGAGGYHRTEVEDILPVSMDVTNRKVMPKGALAIVLHTCEFPQGNTWGKRITKQAIKVLGNQDEVGVLVFDWNGGEQWLFQLTPAGEYPKLARLINNAQIGDMPDFRSTMKMALAGLKKSDAATKHMIIISDGDPQPPPQVLLQQFNAARITISTVAIFPHNNDVRAMRAIANATGGNFYYPNDPAKLPSIFIKEAKTLKRSMIQNKTFTPALSTAGIPSPVLKGIEGLPQLHGYVITTLKPAANMVLSVPDSEDDEPILAIWRTGVGKTAAFTSDLSTNWGKDWLKWEQYDAFIKQLVIDISRPKREGHLRLQSYAGSGEGVILVEDYAPQSSFMNITAQVAGPRQSRHRVELKQVGPRRYEGRFPLTGQGRYQIMALGTTGGGGREERVHGGFVVPYSQEYLRFRADPIVLEEIARKTGGQMLNGQETGEQIFQRNRKITTTDRPIADWFLLVLACLIPLDVAARRVQIDWTFFKSKTHTPADETFTQLLKTKRTVQTELRQQRPQQPAPLRHPAGDKVEPAQDKPQVDQTSSTSTTSTTSTTERLLAARKKLRDQDHD